MSAGRRGRTATPAGRSCWRSWCCRLLVAYVVLLLTSHGVRLVRSAPAPVAGGVAAERFLAPETDGEGRSSGERRIPLAYRDHRAGTPEDVARSTLPVLLLHGSPGTGGDLRDLGTLLADRHRVLEPDFPGFGASARAAPSYSIRAHAGYMRALLDELEVERVHLVAFSMGGGVALELTDMLETRVASLTMISSIGVQELELLGDYHLNHALHGLQLGALWALFELVPHFGLFDDGMLSIEYARNFYDTDQRPLRGHLEAWDGPTLILHGSGDVLVPFAAAEEHHRLVPQSELVAFDGNHFLVFRRAAELFQALEPFLERVEAGTAPTRASAGPERQARASEPFDFAALEPMRGFTLVIFLVMIGLGTLVSEDLTCIAVGAFIGQGRLEFLPGVLACFLGIYVGDLLLFLAGRLIGRQALGRAPLSYFLDEERVDSCSRWFERRGPVVIFLSRFMPGMRLPTYFAAGILRTGFLRFSLWFFLAAALWTPILVWLASRVGGVLSERLELLQRNLLWALLATLFSGFLLVKVVRPLLTQRGRSLLVVRWLRVWRWEYWPLWVFYPPIVLGALFHGLRRGKPLGFTAVNPCMPHGGFVGESKAAILRGLGGKPEHVARTEVVAAGASGEEARGLARAFLAELGGAWPLVVKPDVGQRGAGVRVVHSEDQLLDALEDLGGDVLLQEYIDGLEYGLFYARHPDAAHGSLRSITRKILPAVTGDGSRTLERLILEDDRARCMARHFLREHTGAAEVVPAAGERITLGDLGTHCLGAAFLDGADHWTPELERAVDELARSYDGFYFGRFDVRAESADALAAGRFRVLELNGVTGEEAHVYDPRHSVWYAWRTLINQWRTAYDIGIANARRGARISKPRELFAAYREYRRSASGAVSSASIVSVAENVVEAREVSPDV